MPDPVIPAAAPISAIDTEWKPFWATRSAAAARILLLRSGSRVRAGAPDPAGDAAMACLQ
ncbi:hypothetical protein GCM10009645_54400 [Mycolicibacterium poriferae]|uniref:Uncharacterized protein n=1 Tax=Mycolicibacterium poriferae TaxID=39694 RepID=A0A6N4VGK5_9MYCO|nr:hypothetical protein MPOR_41360 [Mycolicibacterium poriferae]